MCVWICTSARVFCLEHQNHFCALFCSAHFVPKRLLCCTNRSQRANYSSLCLLNQHDAKTKNTFNRFNTLSSHQQIFTLAHKSRMTITIACVKKNRLKWSILKARVITAIPQLPSPTLFVLSWFGTGSPRSGHGKAGEIEHVLMSSVWDLLRKSGQNDTLPITRLHWRFMSTFERRMISFTVDRGGDCRKACANTYRRYFGPFISVWSWSTWNVLRHTSAWCMLTSCCNMCHISERKPQHIEVFIHTAEPCCIKLSGEQLKALLKAPTNTLLQAYQAVFNSPPPKKKN